VWQALRHDFGAVSLSTWGLLLFYSLAASVATVWLWMRGLRNVPASRAGVFTVLLPVAATLVGVIVLREPFGAAHAAAFVLALVGLLLATWPGRGAAQAGMAPT
jgi:drug/metabolite transporter (DMT)-like permease